MLNDDVEKVLSALYCEVLGIRDVARDDDFFDLGGHSLIGVRLVNRIRAELGVQIDLYHVFDAPTVADLAEVVRGA